MDDAPLSLELLAYRVSQAEILQKAMQYELYTLRKERELYVKRAELEHQADVRRQWPIALAGFAVAFTSIASLILQLAR